MELLCPAGTLQALEVAVDSGADAIYCGFNNQTNARNFPGLNFSKEEMREGIAYAHKAGAKINIAINTFAEAGNVELWYEAIDNAYELKADALIIADIGLLEYCKNKYPDMDIHLSVQATASTADSINYFTETYGIKRVVLPRVISNQEILRISKKINVDIEVFVYGGLCVMAEGRCSLSSYVTGRSPNKDGVCSPAEHVKYESQNNNKTASTLNGSTINIFNQNENPGYPTICKGRFIADGVPSYLFEEPVSLDIISMLPQLKEAGVVSLKIEGRQRNKAYVKKVITSFKAALKSLDMGEEIAPDVLLTLQGMSEGGKKTTGAYDNRWL